MKIVILAPISNHYMNYYDVVKNDSKDNFLIFILKGHLDNYPKILPNNVKLVPLEIWNENYIDFVISKTFSSNVDVIFAYTEEQIEFAAQLRKKYKATGQTITSARQFRNKYVMIQQAEKSGVKIPKYFKVDSVFDLVNASKELEYPFIIKPNDGMGSMNTHVLKNYNDLINIAKKQDIKNMIAEEFIPWDLYHVDGFVCKNQLVYLIPSKYFDNTLCFTKGESVGSVQIQEDSREYSMILSFAKKLLTSFDTPDNYIFHLEVFSNGKEVKFLEIGSRLGGGRILQEIEDEFKFNPIQELLKIELNLQNNIPKNYLHNRTIHGFVLPVPGKGSIVKLPDGFPEKIPFKGIYDHYQYAKLGRKYTGAHNSGEALAAISVKGQTYDYVKKELLKIDDWMKNGTVYE